MTVVTNEEIANFVTIDRSRTSVNGQSYVATNVPIVAEPNSNDAVTVRTVVDNVEGARPALGQFTWDVYASDRINEVTHVASTNREIKLVPGTETVLTHELQDAYEHPYYTIVGTLSVGDDSSADSHIIIPVRTTADPISFYSVDPLDFFTLSTENNPDGNLEALVCYRGSSISDFNDASFEITLKNDNQMLSELVLASDHSSLVTTPRNASYAAAIPLTADFGPFMLTANTYSTDELVSYSTINITCETYPSLCDGGYQDRSAYDSETGAQNRLQLIVSLGLLAILVVLFVGYRMRRQHKSSNNNNIS